VRKDREISKGIVTNPGRMGGKPTSYPYLSFADKGRPSGAVRREGD
jgi:hypothetical protein